HHQRQRGRPAARPLRAEPRRRHGDGGPHPAGHGTRHRRTPGHKGRGGQDTAGDRRPRGERAARPPRPRLRRRGRGHPGTDRPADHHRAGHPGPAGRPRHAPAPPGLTRAPAAAGARGHPKGRVERYLRLYSRIVIGPTTSTNRPAQPSDQAISPAGQSPAITPRTAEARWVTGLLLTNAWSQPGMVEGSTTTLDRKVSGKITIMLTPITDFSVRSIRPNIVQIHEKANANSTSSAIPASTPATPPSGR